MSKQVVHIHKINKAYGDNNALLNASLDVNQGELFGLIGSDGAGKTTLLKIIISLLEPDEGTIEVLGYDVLTEYRKLRQHIGYMPGEFSLYYDLTVWENLQFYATVFGTTIEENSDLIEDIFSPLRPFLNRPAGKLSGGMKQKLALSCALIHRPALLVLDEPTTGVDAVSRREFWEMLSRLKGGELTTIVSTPYMDEAEKCDRIALIQDGRLMQVDTPQSIRNTYEHILYEISGGDVYKLVKEISQWDEIVDAYAYGQFVHGVSASRLNEQNILSKLNRKDVQELRVRRIAPSIEDCFIQLMKKKEENRDETCD